MRYKWVLVAFAVLVLVGTASAMVVKLDPVQDGVLENNIDSTPTPPFENFTQMVDGDANRNYNTTTNPFLRIRSVSETGWYYIGKAYFVFDTSDIPDNAIIESATLRVVSHIGVTQFPNRNFTMTEFNPTDPTNVALGDYNRSRMSDVELSNQFNISTMGEFTDEDTNMTILPDKLTVIDKTGYTGLVLRWYYDFSLNEPSHTTEMDSISFYSSEYEEAQSRPYLEVEYTVPDTPAAPRAASLCGAADALPGMMGIFATILAFAIIIDVILVAAMAGTSGESRKLASIIFVVVTLLIGVMLIIMATFVTGSIPTTLACV